MAARSRCALEPVLRSAATYFGGPVTGDVRWLIAGEHDLDYLTDTDRELIWVVTGEDIPALHPGGMRVSFFTLQIVHDRRHGDLANGRDIGIDYLERLYTAYDEGCPSGNPISGDLLDIGIAYLVGRDLRRQDRGAVA